MEQMAEQMIVLVKSGARLNIHPHLKPGSFSLTIRVIIADDHEIVLEGLGLLLKNEKDIEVVGVATDGRKVLELVASLRPDVVVMDIAMPGMNGIEATRRLVAAHPEIKVVALSAHSHNQYVLEMLEAGASAYITKGNARSELVRALHAVMKGQKYLCPEVAAAVVDNSGEGIHQLGPREREVLQLLAEGGTSSEIAKRLFISTSTVDAHRHNIMKKLDLHGIAELTRYAIYNGLTTMDVAGECEQHNPILETRVCSDEIHASHIETIDALTRAAEHRDDSTGAHVRRIGHYSRCLAETLGMDSDYCDSIQYASSMHDIGKISIPDQILLKSSPLTSDESEIMKSHCSHGAEILQCFPSPCMKMGAAIALNHHERWDGTGYPIGLAGEAIPLAARIVCICDVYDALRAKRPYKPALGHEKVMRIIVDGDGRTMPEHFDPMVLEVFKRCGQQLDEIYQEHAGAH